MGDDLSNYISRDLVEGAVDNGVSVRPHHPGIATRHSAMPAPAKRTAFRPRSHKEGDIAIFDAWSGAAPLTRKRRRRKSRRCSGLWPGTMGDNYATGWVIRNLRDMRPRSSRGRRDGRLDARPETLPLSAAGRVRLLDNKQLGGAIAALERRVMPGGRDRVTTQTVPATMTTLRMRVRARRGS